MGPTEMHALVAGVLADAAGTFGPDADAAVLECYAREATLDLWMERPGLTVRETDLVLRRVLEAMAPDGMPVGVPLPAASAPQDDPRVAAERRPAPPRLAILRDAPGAPPRDSVPVRVPLPAAAAAP